MDGPRERWAAVAQEIPGILLIFLGGSLLHFTYAWSGQSRIVGVFSAVNESVWEHTKMAFWPGLLLILVRYPLAGRRARNYWLARSVGLLLMPAVIATVFYAYTWALGRHLLAIDILLFLVAIIVGQLVAVWIQGGPDLGPRGNRAGVLLLLLLTGAFVVCTFWPPRVDLFLDHGRGTYGIPLGR